MREPSDSVPDKQVTDFIIATSDEAITLLDMLAGDAGLTVDQYVESMLRGAMHRLESDPPDMSSLN